MLSSENKPEESSPLEGDNPDISAVNIYWPVAQGLERHSYKVEVVGSIPTGPTNRPQEGRHAKCTTKLEA